jgi:hypothetical protein
MFHKGLEDLYACIAVILYQFLSCDVMFGNTRILVFHKGLEDLYMRRAKT